jgi:A/G-specific adenine glycosylase
MIASQSKKNFSDKILEWHRHHGRYDLPWQKNKDPYLVWISEIMLQQTQVSTVIPFYIKFIDRFRTIGDLAEASEDEVMAYWSGLGFYSRARNLHKSAKIIADQFSCRFPDSYENLIQLPGIGRSTAGAILSFCYKKKICHFRWQCQASVKSFFWYSRKYKFN